MNVSKLLDSLKKHEGFREDAYLDSVGVWTIGYGRNLQTLRTNESQAAAWLREDAETAISAAEKFPEYAACDTDARRNAFIEMVYNLGPGRLRGFKLTLAAIAKKNWEAAEVYAMDSLWAKQVGQRAKVLTTMLRTGKFPD